MFTYVLQEVIRVLIVYLPTLLAFACSFYVLSPWSTGFDNPITSILKVVSMMIGELDYEDNFTTEQSLVAGHSVGSVQMLYMLFLVFANIVIANLIIGLTVNKVESLQAAARTIQLEKLVYQVTFKQ